MLKDSRVKVNEPSNSGCTPLWFAACVGPLPIIKWWIASGREKDLGEPGDVDKTDAIGGAKKLGRTDVATLLERFKNTVETRDVMREEIGWYEKSDAAKIRSEVRKELGITGQFHSFSPLIKNLFSFLQHNSFIN